MAGRQKSGGRKTTGVHIRFWRFFVTLCGQPVRSVIRGI
jgi:hypothetical protein